MLLLLGENTHTHIHTHTQVETCKCEMKLLRESTEDAKKRLSGEESALETLLSKAATDKTDLSSAKYDVTRVCCLRPSS